MPRESIPPARLIQVRLWAALAIPSLFVVQKYGGWSAALIYAAAAAVGVALHTRIPPPRESSTVRHLTVATMTLVFGVVLAIYPIANVHSPGVGSDDDDTYNIGARALLVGQSPYDQTTYLGNVLHPLPGSFVLAMPFVLLGTSALQNPFWLTLFFFAVRVETRRDGIALRLAWLVLACSPTVMHQLATGTGRAANTIYVLLGLWWLARARNSGLAAVIWGVTLASRANFLFLVPIAFGWLRQRHGWAPAIRSTAIACATVAALTVPFYLHDPLHFGPLDGANRIMRFNASLPHAGELILVSMAALAVALGCTRMNDASLFDRCAAVQAWPVVVGSLLDVWQTGGLDLAFTSYGTFFAWFLLMRVACSESYSSVG